MPQSDTDLMLRVHQGETHLFEELVRRHHRPLLNFFYRLSWDRHQAEDGVQEVFLRLYRNRGKYRATAKFTTYMYRIAHNYWIDICRSRKNKPPLASLDMPLDASSDSTLAEQLPGDGIEPPQQAMDTEVMNQLKSALDCLNPGQRLVFILSNHQGMKYEEISEVLKIPVGTVKSRMHETVNKLREKLKEKSIG